MARGDIGFPDVALEAVSGSTLANTPDCKVCEGLLWAGEVVRVLDDAHLAHESCYQGSLVHTIKGARAGLDIPPGTTWVGLLSRDPRKKAAVAALRKAAGATTQRVTMVKVSKCGRFVSGDVLKSSTERWSGFAELGQ